GGLPSCFDLLGGQALQLDPLDLRALERHPAELRVDDQGRTVVLDDLPLDLLARLHVDDVGPRGRAEDEGGDHRGAHTAGEAWRPRGFQHRALRLRMSVDGKRRRRTAQRHDENYGSGGRVADTILPTDDDAPR